MADSDIDTGAYLQTMLPDKNIYQLHGGIQRYIETSNEFFVGKNFVFDPRRFDPNSKGGVVGTCMICKSPHDDYDNGRPPREDHTARCCKCLILLLVCETCRANVCCHGEQFSKPKLYCGGDVCKARGVQEVSFESR